MSYSISRSALLNLFTYLYLLIVSLATTPTLIRYLGVSLFGQYVLYLGLLALFTSIDLGLSRAVVYYLAKTNTQAKHKLILGSSLTLHLALGIIFFLICHIYLNSLLGLLVLLTFVVAHYQAYPESCGNFLLVNIRSFIIGTANTVLAAYLASQGYGIDQILLGLIISTIVVIIILALSSPGINFTLSSQKYYHKILMYGIKLQGGKIVNALQAQYPKLLLATNPLSLTIVSLAGSLVTKAAGAVLQLSIAFFPHSVKSKQPTKLKQYYFATQGIILLASLIAIICYNYFGYTLLLIWLDNVELASQLHKFLLIYRYYALLLVLTPLASALLESKNKPGTTSLYAAYALLIELVAVYLLYDSYQAYSIAYAGVLSLAIMVPTLLFTTQKYIFPRDKQVR